MTLSKTGGLPGYAVSVGSSGSTISVVNLAQGLPGQVNAATTPLADGTWTLDLTVPLDAPPSGSYTISALCATRLELDEAGLAVAPASTADAWITSGPFTIER